MTEVECEVMFYNVKGRGPAVVVECGRCGHRVSSWGHGENSIRRSCAQLRETCLEDEVNYYIVDEARLSPESEEIETITENDLP